MTDTMLHRAQLAERNKLLELALHWTASLKGKARDRAIFDYLCGANAGIWLSSGDGSPTAPCPPWLWVIGIRAGDRVREIERMLATPIETEAAE